MMKIIIKKLLTFQFLYALYFDYVKTINKSANNKGFGRGVLFMKKTAQVFNIQRYSLHDGPGIRTLVFFKGCPLKCAWCANPEGLHRTNEVRYITQKCNSCANCQQACPQDAITAIAGAGFAIDRAKCVSCGACATKCYRKAKMLSGYEIDFTELMGKILKDKAYFESSGGGVTLGGGDPLMQGEFAQELLTLCHSEGIKTAIETTAFCSFETYRNCALLCDTVFTDFKAFDEQKHLALTGVSNKKIMDNIKQLDKVLLEQASGAEFIIRIPLLPEINFSLSDMQEATDFLKSLSSVKYIEILPFHNLGESKYQQLGMEYQFEGKDNLKSSDVKEYADILGRAGLTVKVTDW